MSTSVSIIEDKVRQDAQLEAMTRNVLASFNDYVHLNRRVPDEVLSTANNIGNPVLLSYTVASHLILKVAVKQAVLEEDDLTERLVMTSRQYGIQPQELSVRTRPGQHARGVPTPADRAINIPFSRPRREESERLLVQHGRVVCAER